MEDIITSLSTNIGVSYQFAEITLACCFAIFTFLFLLLVLVLLSSISYLISHFLLDNFYVYFFENGQAYLSSRFDTKAVRSKIEKKYNLKIVRSCSSRCKNSILIRFSYLDIVNFMKYKDYGGSENGSL